MSDITRAAARRLNVSRAALAALGSLMILAGPAAAQQVDDLVFFEGNGCTQDIVFTYSSHRDADDNCKDGGACDGDNDEARSLRILKSVKQGAKIILFDSPDGQTDDDFNEITVVDKDFLQPEGYCLTTFESTFSNPDINSGIQTDYVRKNGLDGKVSRVRVVAAPPQSTSAALTLADGAPMLAAAHSGQCVDVFGFSGDDGAVVHQWPCHGGPNQRFTWRDGMLVAQHSGKCLDVAGFSHEQGTPIIQWACHGGANQRWDLLPAGEGAVALRSRESGQCLDVFGFSGDAGAKLIQWPCHGGPNQAFFRRG